MVQGHSGRRCHIFSSLLNQLRLPCPALFTDNFSSLFTEKTEAVRRNVYIHLPSNLVNPSQSTFLFFFISQCRHWFGFLPKGKRPTCDLFLFPSLLSLQNCPSSFYFFYWHVFFLPSHFRHLPWL